MSYIEEEQHRKDIEKNINNKDKIEGLPWFNAALNLTVVIILVLFYYLISTYGFSFESILEDILFWFFLIDASLIYFMREGFKNGNHQMYTWAIIFGLLTYVISMALAFEIPILSFTESYVELPKYIYVIVIPLRSGLLIIEGVLNSKN